MVLPAVDAQVGVVLPAINQPIDKSYKAAEKQNNLQIEVTDLGIISFEKAYKYQKEGVEEVKSAQKAGKLLLLEHTDCITAGVSTLEEEIASCKLRIKNHTTQIPIIKTDRGGKITAHNIGQLTGYPIINLQLYRLSIKTFIEKVLSAVQESVSNFGLKTQLIVDKNRTGLWVDNKKICFLGIKVTRFISFHGFTLNVNNDLNIFNLFTPCGIENCEVTSIQKELKEKIDMDALKKNVAYTFIKRFSQ